MTIDIILSILNKKYKILNNLSVFEIGCGHERLAIELCQLFYKYTAIDKNNENIINAKINTFSLYNNLEFRIENINNEINDLLRYDIIISKNCVHFIKNFDKFFSKINDLLLTNGIIMIIEPIIEPNNWMDNTLNEKSEFFNIDIWNFKKNQLLYEHEYIMNNCNVKYYEYAKCRIYIIEK